MIVELQHTLLSLFLCDRDCAGTFFGFRICLTLFDFTVRHYNIPNHSKVLPTTNEQNTKCLKIRPFVVAFSCPIRYSCFQKRLNVSLGHGFFITLTLPELTDFS